MTKSRSTLALVFAIAHAIGVTHAAPPRELEAVPVPNQLGLVTNDYAFQWQADHRISYRLLVATDREKLDADVGDLWDSGRRFRGGSADGILYRGKAIPAGSTAWWKVRVWGAETDLVEAWSEPASIEVPSQFDTTTEFIAHPTHAGEGELKFTEGRTGNALVSGADHPRVWADDYPGLRPTESGTTLSAWIKPTKVTDGWQCIYRQDSGSARRLLAIGAEGSFWGLWCGFGIGGRYVEFGAAYDQAKLGDGEWHHVAASYDSEHLRLFVDGEAIGEQATRGALNAASAPGYIGSFSGKGEVFEGAIDELRIYSKPLTAAAISELAAAESEVENDALTAYWNFDGTIENEMKFIPDARPQNRVVFLGGTMVYNMEKHGHLEAAITSRWPQHDITFRNLGWPADDVFGTARSEFGSAQNTRSWKPPGAKAGFGFDELMRQVREVGATTVLVAYGAETAFFTTDAEWEDWQKGYLRLLEELRKTGAHLVLVTPIAQGKHRTVLPDPSENNSRLGRTAKFIMSVAKERGLHGTNLSTLPFNAWHRDNGTNTAYSDGVHLTENGHLNLAIYIALGLDLPLGGYTFYHAAGNGNEWVTSEDGETHTKVRVPGDHPSWMTLAHGLATGHMKTKRGYRFDAQLDRLPSPFGRGAVRSPWREDGDDDGPEIAVRIGGDDEVGRYEGGTFEITDGPDQKQARALRQKIIEKNQFHRYKIRPINKAYIFLFRRHEMGHLAYELEDFDELIAGHERAIAHLRKPHVHSYDIERVEDWKSPRDYPDHEVPQDIPAPDLDAELAAFTVADGFEVNLFASDPMIANPINLNWDTRGRAWVSTSSTYPHIKPGRIPNDRIVILEDIDRDGVADKHTVFAEGLTVPHSVMPVPGGAYICSTTELLFLADADGDDVAESRQVIYSGFGNADVHHMIHGLRWAPWGDLHFTQSIYINSFVETPHGPRRMNGSGIWRLRPETRELDALAVGMVNPWGFALDKWGQSFGTDGAGGSGPHYVFPGAAFRSAVGAHRVLEGLIPGKPKNTAAEFVSGRHTPDHWQGSVLANDFRANRTVRYALKENGSGYSAEEVETVLHSSHRSFRPVDLKMGPEGALYVVDWYNPIIDHGEVDFHHPMRDKSHGRIWRVTAKGRPPVERPTIHGAPIPELLDLLQAPEQYTRTQANREIASRPCQGLTGQVLDWVAALDPAGADFERHRLEALWALMAKRVGSPELLEQVLRSPDHRARAAAVRAVSNWRSRAGKIDQLAPLKTAIADAHPQVRLEAVNALRRLGSLEAAAAALRALDHPTDGNLDFALELTVRSLRDVWLPALERGEPVFDGDPSRLNYALREVEDPRAIARLLDIVQSGDLEGDALHNAVRTIAALGEATHLDQLLSLPPAQLANVAAGARFNQARPSAPETLIAQLKGDAADAAAELCGRWGVSAAIKPLAERLRQHDSAAAADALAKLDATEELKRISTPISIAAWATVQPTEALTSALATLSQPIIAAYLQHTDGPAILAEALTDVEIDSELAIAATRLAHASGRDVAPLVAALHQAGRLKTVGFQLDPDQRRALLADAARDGDATRGRAIYQRKALLCATCHTIDNEGGQLGPDLSTVGSYMTPESLLESLLNPSTDIKQGYETVLLTTKANTVVTGLLQRKTADAHLIRDPSGKVVSVPNADVAKLDTSPASLMPPGLTASLRRDELIDLMRYLTSLGKSESKP